VFVSCLPFLCQRRLFDCSFFKLSKTHLNSWIRNWSRIATTHLVVVLFLVVVLAERTHSSLKPKAPSFQIGSEIRNEIWRDCSSRKYASIGRVGCLDVTPYFQDTHMHTSCTPCWPTVGPITCAGAELHVNCELRALSAASQPAGRPNSAGDAFTLWGHCRLQFLIFNLFVLVYIQSPLNMTKYLEHGIRYIHRLVRI